jgi:hypothetical protein
MVQKNILAIIWILIAFLVPAAYAGSMDLTTYYPAPYGEYQELRSTGNSYFATTTGNVGIGTVTPGGRLSIVQDMTMGNDVTDGSFQLGIHGATDFNKRLILGYDTNGNGFGFIKAGNRGVRYTPLVLQPNGGGVGIGTTTPNTADLYICDGGGPSSVAIDGANTSTASLSLMTKALGGSEAWNDRKYWLIAARGNAFADVGSRNDFFISFRNGLNDTWSNRFYIDQPTGFVGISTNNPLATLDVNGDIRVATGQIFSGTRCTGGSYYLDLQGDRNMVLYDSCTMGTTAIWASGTQTSDIRLKKDITDLGPMLGIVEKLNPIRFHYKEGVYDDKPHIGLSAQELEKFFPEFVYTPPSSENKLIFYDKISVVLIQAIKELKKEKDEEVESLKSESRVQQRVIESLRSESREQIELLKKEIAAIKEKK